MANNEYILLQFPNEIAIKDTGNPISVKRYSDSNFATLLRSPASSDITIQYNTNNFYEHVLILNLCVSDCTAGTTFYLTVTNLRNNYFITQQDLPMTISSLDTN
jgi:hypothetical protein